MMDEKQKEAFQAMMLTQFARLSEQAGKYVSGMSGKDREKVLSGALEIAEERSESFSPRRQSLLDWWDSCVKSAVSRQHLWRVRRFDGWMTVTAESIVNPFPLGEL